MNLKVNGCCCISLRTAGLVLGWLGIASSILSTAGNIMMFLSETTSNITPSGNSGYRVICLVTSIAFSIFNFLICSFLIEGIKANKHRFLLPWLILNGIQLAIGSVIVSALAVYSVSVIASKPYLILFAVIFALFHGLGCWAWIAVYSLYKEIRIVARNTLLLIESVGAAPPHQISNTTRN